MAENVPTPPDSTDAPTPLPKRAHPWRAYRRAIRIRLLAVRKSVRRLRAETLRWAGRLRSWYKRNFKDIKKPTDTQTESLWNKLIDWPVVSAVALAGIGIGVGVLSMAPSEFLTAKACFAVSTAILLAKVVHWLGTSKATRRERMLLAFFIFGFVGVGLVEALHWVKNREQAHSAATTQGNDQAPPTAQAQTPIKTLHDLYLSDCKPAEGFKLTGTRTLTNEDKPVYEIEYYICADLIANVKYVYFYLPESDYTEGACRFLPNVYRDVMEKDSGMMESVKQQRPGEKEESAAQLKDSGRVFIYHETYLLPSRIEELTRGYKEVGLFPQFRGRDYLISMNSALVALTPVRTPSPSAPTSEELLNWQRGDPNNPPRVGFATGVKPDGTLHIMFAMDNPHRFPAFDIGGRLWDMDKLPNLKTASMEKIYRSDIAHIDIPSLAPNTTRSIVSIDVPPSINRMRFGAQFTTRAGAFSENIAAQKVNNRWLFAIQVRRFDATGEVMYRGIDPDFPLNAAGDVDW